METPILIRLGATTEFWLIVIGNTGWFPGLLPIGGSAATEAILVIGTAVALHEVVACGIEIASKLRDWWRGKPG